MDDYLLRITEIKRQHIELRSEIFELSKNGTHHKVFLSKDYVIRFRDDNPTLIGREADLLKKLDHLLIPKILWRGDIDGSNFVVENRLPGKNINTDWRNIGVSDQTNIIKQIINFLRFLRTQTQDHVYSVNTGKRYDNFYDLLTDGFIQKITKIKTFAQTKSILEDLLKIHDDIVAMEPKELFSNREKQTLVHGDLIIHNLLSDGKNLTGVLDWELSLFGDLDYDLSRLFYYQECAKAYQEQGIDESFESDYMNKLMTAVSESTLIQDKELFFRKHIFMRSIYFVNALYWAVNSEDPQSNIDELVTQWDKKGGIKYFRT